MYGDCQVLSSIGSAGEDNSLYQLSIQNPNFNFMSSLNSFNMFSPVIPKEEVGMGSSKEKMMESGNNSMSEQQMEFIGGLSGNEQEGGGDMMHDQQQQSAAQTKKKRYHRHTARQIQEMEAFFKECPHPDDKQRLKLSQDLGLKPRQVKFWFQNRRTQMKAQHDRQDNAILRAENEGLKNENYRLQAALRNIMCPSCGGQAMLGEMGYDEQQLRVENVRLKEEFDRVCCLVSQCTGRPMQPMMGSLTPLIISPNSIDQLDVNSAAFTTGKYDHVNGCPNDGQDHDHIISLPNFMPENIPQFALIAEEEKPQAMEFAASAANELKQMCECDEPLWTKDRSDNNSGNKEVLNVEEYARAFSWNNSGGSEAQRREGVRTEATRDTSVVIMNSITLVDAFMDANKWMELFPSIISRARMLQVVQSGISGNPNGSLYLMYAELQFLSPLVPTRETQFLRYCQHIPEEGSWIIVDFPLNNNSNNIQNSYGAENLFPYYKRCPSGCIIQDMPNGYSRVTWVEHEEIEDGPIHQVFNQLVSSGAAFGAKRWLAVLQRQCERLASLMARNISDIGVIQSPEARRNLMNLSQRMIRTFCVNISSSFGQSWTALSESAEDTVRITTRKTVEPGQPNGLVLTAVCTTWLPYKHTHVFDFLRDERRRAQIEVLSNGNSLHEIAHIANGSHPGNCISLLRINVASNSSQSVELILQESCSDESGSMVVYSTMDVDAVQLVINGEDPSCVPLLPLGFVVVPHSMEQRSVVQCDDDDEETATTTLVGCLLTVGLQVLASTVPNAKLNLSIVTATNNHLCGIAQQIGAVLGNGAAGEGSVGPEPEPAGQKGGGAEEDEEAAG